MTTLGETRQPSIGREHMSGLRKKTIELNGKTYTVGHCGCGAAIIVEAYVTIIDNLEGRNREYMLYNCGKCGLNGAKKVV